MRKHFYILLFFVSLLSQQIYSQPCTPSRYSGFNKCCGIGNLKTSIGNTVIYDSTWYSSSGIYIDGYDSNSFTMTTGNNYTFTIKTQTYNHAVCVWFDENHNDTFETGEIWHSNTMINPGNYSFTVSPKACNDSFRVRILVDYYYYYNNGTSFDPCQSYYGDVYDFKLYTLPASGTDVGAASITSNFILNQGPNPLTVKYRNFGNTSVDSARLYYNVNNGTIYQENVSGLNFNSCTDYVHQFSDSVQASNGTYIIKSWIKYPDGTDPDANSNNDTVVQMACVALNGNYTIDGSQATGGSNFKTFNDAISILNSCGVSGPVIFTVAAGSYKDSLTIGTISGVSSTNTIIFDGVDTASRFLTCWNNVAITFNEASFITIKNLSIRSGTTNASGIYISGECTYINIDSCSIRCSSQGQYAVYFSPLYKGGSYYGANNCRVTYTAAINYNYSIFLIGGYTAGNYGYANQIIGNKIYGQYYGLICQYQDTANIRWNNINGFSSYGIYCYNADNSFIYNNKLSGQGYGYMLYYLDNTEIVNNWADIQGTNYGGQFYYCTSNKIYHNTFYTPYYSAYFTNCSSLDIRNNIFHTSGSGTNYAFYAVTPNQFSNLDYNSYTAPSSSKYVFLGADFANLTALKGQNNFNFFSSNSNPTFVNSGANPRNLHLANTWKPSFGDYTVGITTDIDGDSRCTIAPTVGADESNYVLSVPKSSFSAPDTGFVNSPTYFTNANAFNQGYNFEWYVDTATVPTATTQDLNHVFPATGTFNVKLNTINCSYSHDTTRSIVIITPTLAPKSNFTANRTTIDPNENIIFKDLTTGGPTGWSWSITGGTKSGAGIDYDFVNGTDSNSQNPEVLFYYPGFYDVCLTTSNSAGSNSVCKSQYITVYDVLEMCNMASSSSMIGHFYDEGGKFNNYPYANNKSCNVVIAPCSGPITMSFSKVQYDTNYAYLNIYDGKNNSGKLLNTKAVKVNTNYIAKSGFMYIEWFSQYGSNVGWEGTWTTQYQFIPKSPADIKCADTAFNGALHYFEPLYYKDDVTYDWDFDNDGTIDNQGRYVNYIYYNTGVVTAVCYATSCGGVDTFYKDILVVNPSSAPSPIKFAMDNSGGYACQLKPMPSYNVEVGTSAQLFDMSGNGPTSWSWAVVNSTGNYSWDNGNAIQNPTITFYDTGYYSIELTATNAAGSTTQTFTNVIRAVDFHCTPTVTNVGTDFGFVEVQFKDMINKSSYNTYYMDYTSNGATCVESGSKYGIRLKRQTNSANCRIGVWIDFNQDGDFNDAGELVKVNNNYTGLIYSDSIKIPALSNTVKYGWSVMRVGIISTASFFQVCGTNNTGEFEDYALFINDDQIPPVISRIGADTITTEQCLTFKDPGATAKDNLDGIFPASSVGSINTQIIGYYTITYVASDKAGNAATPVTRVVHVTGDLSAPVISLNGNSTIYHNVNTAFNDPGASAYDSCSGTSSVSVMGSVDTSLIGNYTLTYIASDANGNTDSVSRTVIVVDSLAPVIVLAGADSINWTVKTSFIDPGFSVVDNYDPNPSVTITPTIIDSSIIHWVVITYTATDNNGNSSNRKRWVHFIDDVAPVISLNGADTVYVEAKGAYTELGASVTDNYDAGVTVTVSGGPVNTSILGPTILYYTSTDASGNTAVKSRIVIVRKTSKPIIILTGNATVNLFTYQTYTDPGVTFSDAFYTDSQLRPNLTNGGSFPNPATTAGNYNYWYHVIDPSGNASDTAYRNFVITTNGIQNQNQINKIAVYPNPTSCVVYITGMSNFNNRIDISDMNGKIIHTAFTSSDIYMTDINHHPAGIYLIRITNEKITEWIKFEVIR